jgi:acetyl esterase/lipase
VVIPDRHRRLRTGVPLGAGAGRNARRGRESRVVFAGDTSGSNFEATAALRADDAGRPLPKAVVMLRAWINSIESRYRVAIVDFDSAP